MAIHPDIQILIDAGLRPLQVSRLIPVTRAGAWKWYKGLSEPNYADDSRRVRDLARLVEAVKAALRDGKLPVASSALTNKEVADLTFATATKYMLATT